MARVFSLDGKPNPELMGVGIRYARLMEQGITPYIRAIDLTKLYGGVIIFRREGDTVSAMTQTRDIYISLRDFRCISADIPQRDVMATLLTYYSGDRKAPAFIVRCVNAFFNNVIVDDKEYVDYKEYAYVNESGQFVVDKAAILADYPGALAFIPNAPYDSVMPAQTRRQIELREPPMVNETVFDTMLVPIAISGYRWSTVYTYSGDPSEYRERQFTHAANGTPVASIKTAAATKCVTVSQTGSLSPGERLPDPTIITASFPPYEVTFTISIADYLKNGMPDPDISSRQLDYIVVGPKTEVTYSVLGGTTISRFDDGSVTAGGVVIVPGKKIVPRRPFMPWREMISDYFITPYFIIGGDYLVTHRTVNIGGYDLSLFDSKTFVGLPEALPDIGWVLSLSDGKIACVKIHDHEGYISSQREYLAHGGEDNAAGVRAASTVLLDTGVAPVALLYAMESDVVALLPPPPLRLRRAPSIEDLQKLPNS